MNKLELIDSLDSAHVSFLDSLEGLTPEQLVQPGATGKWSVKDVLSHLLLWEGQTVQLLFQARQGTTPTTLHLKQVDDDVQNEIWYQQMKDRPLERVWDDFLHIRDQTIERVETFSEEELDLPDKFPWLNDASLGALVLDYTAEHDREHEANIRAWRKEQNI